MITELEDPLRSGVRDAFGDSFAVIWRVMAGTAGAGLAASLFMKALPLHTEVDKRWGFEDAEASVTAAQEMPAVVESADIKS